MFFFVSLVRKKHVSCRIPSSLDLFFVGSDMYVHRASSSGIPVFSWKSDVRYSNFRLKVYVVLWVFSTSYYCLLFFFKSPILVFFGILLNHLTVFKSSFDIHLSSNVI